jgi:hypothetical protein
VAELDPAHLHRPEAEWPLLLAGPILRRVTTDSAAVFVAMRDECNVELHVYDSSSPSSAVVATTTDGEHLPPRVIKLGRKLYVSVMQVRGQFAPGHEYGYDISVFVDGTEYRFADLTTSNGDDGVGLLDGPVPLGYAAGLLPTFVVPITRDRLKLIQASCRKPHGGVYDPVRDPDVLPVADRLFQEHRKIADPAARITARPDQLLLTGDQIYADDVPATMLAALTALTDKLLGWGRPETWPNISGSPIDPADDAVAPGERSFFLDDQSVKIRPLLADRGRRRTEELEVIAALDPDDPVRGGAWEDYAANHLLFFGEFCAMYLMMWSPTLWQTRDNFDPEDRIVDPNSSTYYLQRATDAWVHSGDTTTPALVLADGVPFVRRAMANIATYMMFDDHDVTDDWFLNKAVHDRLRFGDPNPSAGGRRLMRNALCAYAVFQHWGNDPEAFESGFGLEILDAVDVSVSTDGLTPQIGQAGDEASLDNILDIGLAPAPHIVQAARMRWDYLIEFPSHRLLALDTRTWREFPSDVSQLGTDEIAAAAAERVEQAISWGLDELRELVTTISALTIPIVDAAAQAYQDLLDAGADLVEAAADAAEALRAAAANALSQVTACINAAHAYVDALIGTTAYTDHAWADTALAAAEAEVDAWAPDSTAVDSAMSAAEAINAAVLHLRTATPRTLATFAVAVATTAEQKAAAALWATADFLDAVADFVRAAGVSHAQAARAAVRLGHAWIALVGAPSITLHNLSAAARAAVNSALGSAANTQAALQAAADAYTQYVDPVVDLLVGSGAEALNAGLISDGALDFQVRDRLAGDTEDTPFTVIISPAPLFGNWLVEVAQKIKVMITGDAEISENEPWSANVRAYHRALRALAPLGSAVVVSGDVHYAFSTVNDFSSAGGLDARFVQLTSSSAKNSMSITMKLAAHDELNDADSLWDLPHEARQLPLEFLQSLPDDLSDFVPTKRQVETMLSTLAMEVLQELEEFGDLLVDPHWGWNLTSNFEKLKDAHEWAMGWAYWMWQMMSGSSWELLYSLPLRYHNALMLLHDFGLDPGHFDQIESTVLHDRRTVSRLHDSPGLDARITAEVPFERNVIIRSQRRTVGSCNIGVITFASTPVEMVVHDLHYFPQPLYETSADLWLSDGPATEFRPDWIVARHVAGLRFGTTADLGLDDPLEAAQ